jgi:hypothetical protein
MKVIGAVGRIRSVTGQSRLLMGQVVLDCFGELKRRLPHGRKPKSKSCDGSVYLVNQETATAGSMSPPDLIGR